jgi:hypothetical protein
VVSRSWLESTPWFNARISDGLTSRTDEGHPVGKSRGNRVARPIEPKHLDESDGRRVG